MATRTIVMHICDNCGAASEDVEEFTFAHGRIQRKIEVGSACGCATKLHTLMDKGQVASVTINGKRRGRPSKATVALREAQAQAS